VGVYYGIFYGHVAGSLGIVFGGRLAELPGSPGYTDSPICASALLSAMITLPATAVFCWLI